MEIKNISYNLYQIWNTDPKCQYGPLHDFSPETPIFKRARQPGLCSYTHENLSKLIKITLCQSFIEIPSPIQKLQNFKF